MVGLGRVDMDGMGDMDGKLGRYEWSGSYGLGLVE